MDMNPPPVGPATFGKKDDAVATTDTGTFTFMSLVKRLLQYLGDTTPAQIQGDVAPGASDTGTNPVQVGGVTVTTPASIGTGKRASLNLGTFGSLRVTMFPDNSPTAISTSSPGRGSSGSLGRFAVKGAMEAYNGSTYDPVQKASLHRLLSSDATVNSTNVKGSAGEVFGIKGYNNNAAAMFFKLYNKATAPAVGTDTPVATYRLAPTANFAITVGGALGAYFSAGIGYGLTTASADGSTAAVASGDIQCLVIDYA